MNSGISRMIRERKDMLKGKNVILGVTGSIAAYKIASLASALKKLSCNVDVIMTENACNFINPITFETLTGNKCLVDTFDRNFQYSVEHVSLAKKADLFLVAPASANFIGKAANGIADDMLTTTFMACECKKIVSPAMNTRMFNNPVVKDNMKKLESFNYYREILYAFSNTVKTNISFNDAKTIVMSYNKALKNTSKLNLHTTDENGAKVVSQTELDSVKTLFEKSLK